MCGWAKETDDRADGERRGWRLDRISGGARQAVGQAKELGRQRRRRRRHHWERGSHGLVEGLVGVSERRTESNRRSDK